MRKIFLLFFLTLSANISFAQRETDNWFFGDHASLEFNTKGIPASSNVSAMNTMEGCATISDQFGNLLFYTNGETIWNALHLPMANGTGLSGHWSATQSAIVVPKPGSTSIYYVIVADAAGAANAGISYSEIDMVAANGLGEVLTNRKNIPLASATQSPPYSEKLTAVRTSNNQEYWVIAHRYPNATDQQFLAFKITAAGPVTAPVISTFPTNRPTPFTGEIGYMKASPNGRFLGVNYVLGGCQLYSFNTKNGTFSGQVNLGTGNGQSYYGLEFSPDGSKFYTVNSTNNQLEQFSLVNPLPSPQAIISTRFVVANFNGAALQLASNGKIYAVKPGFNNLNVINNPNAAGAACNFQQGPTLAPLTFGRMGLPNFVQSYFAPPQFTFTGICQGSPINFTLASQAGLDSVKWNFGEPLSGGKNVSKAWQPSHIYSFPGFYDVTLTTFSNGDSAVFSRQITLKNKPQVYLGKDTILCKGKSLTLRNAFPASPFNERYRWNTKDTTASITITQSGIYWLELSNGSCTFRDSVKATFVDAPNVNLGPNTTFCNGKPVTLDAGNAVPGTTYLWQPGGQTTQTISVTLTGQYAVKVTRNGCASSSFVNVTFSTPINLNLGPDLEVCEENGEIILKGPTPLSNPPTFYLWNDGSTAPTLKLNKTGKYWLRVKRGNCTETDTINITYKPCPPPPVPIIPNIITPNNDHANDKFEIKNIPVGEWKLKIFNRWGVLVFETDKYFNNWPQKELNDGIYYYLLEDTSTNRKFKGWLESVH